MKELIEKINAEFEAFAKEAQQQRKKEIKLLVLELENLL